MYKEGVVNVRVAKYKKASSDLLQKVFDSEFHFRSSNNKGWVCKTCDTALLNGKMPTQAKANGLKLDPVPTELSDLNSLELRLISMRIPFMKMVALPRGQQRSIHGPAVNIPSNLTTICHLLPRLPSETQLIPMKLKRKLTYKGHYMYQYVSSEKLMNALRWLKIHNSIYSNTVINEEWSKQSAVDDTTLFDALTNKSFENNSSSNDISSRLCSTSFCD